MKSKKTKAAKAGKPKKSAKVATIAGTCEIQNGIKKPREGGVCRAVWDTLDGMLAKGAQPTSKDVRELAEKKDWNQNNASIELSRWRKFNGIARPQEVTRKAAQCTSGEVNQHVA